MDCNKVAYIGVNSQDGLELQTLVRDQVISKGLGFEMPRMMDLSSYNTICANYDIVIVDGTIEKDIPHNYKYLMPFPAEHILIVSRNKLPLNFYGSGDCLFNPKDGKMYYNSPLLTGKEKISNRSLLDWIELQLEDLLQIYKTDPAIINYYKKLFKNPLNIVIDILKGQSFFDEVKKIENNRKNKGGQIFISYRNNPENDTVEKLFNIKMAVESGRIPNVEAKTVRFFPPGTLSSEIMSKQRRWQILSMIDRFITPSDEFWVFETDDYYNSWWTLGELLTLSYAAFSGRRIPKVKILRPDHHSDLGVKFVDAPHDYLPSLSEEEKKRMSRWYANCDPFMMAPESVYAIRESVNVPLIGAFLKKSKYYNDYVWSREFWEDPVLDCKVCRDIGKHKNRFNIHDYLWTRGHWYTNIKSKDLTDDQIVECNHCNTKFIISKHNEPYYLWIPPFKREIVAKYYMQVIGYGEENMSDFSLVQIPAYITEKA